MGPYVKVRARAFASCKVRYRQKLVRTSKCMPASNLRILAVLSAVPISKVNSIELCVYYDGKLIAKQYSYLSLD